MNNSTFYNHKTSPQKPHKTTTQRLTEDQVRLLESNFDSSKKLEPERKQQLARHLGVPPRQVAIWYQNKRARWKNQQLEHDYTMLRLQLDTMLIETRKLKKEVENLRAELKKLQTEQAQRHHKYYNNNNNNNNQAPMGYSISICGEEVGSSSRSLEEDMNNLYCSNELKVEEMYAAACLITSDLGLFGSKKDLF